MDCQIRRAYYMLKKLNKMTTLTRLLGCFLQVLIIPDIAIMFQNKF
jgi:hypothetical protein